MELTEGLVESLRLYMLATSILSVIVLFMHGKLVTTHKYSAFDNVTGSLMIGIVFGPLAWWLFLIAYFRQKKVYEQHVAKSKPHEGFF